MKLPIVDDQKPIHTFILSIEWRGLPTTDTETMFINLSLNYHLSSFPSFGFYLYEKVQQTLALSSFAWLVPPKVTLTGRFAHGFRCDHHPLCCLLPNTVFLEILTLAILYLDLFLTVFSHNLHRDQIFKNSHHDLETCFSGSWTSQNSCTCLILKDLSNMYR